jgi:hypothetical protein
MNLKQIAVTVLILSLSLSMMMLNFNFTVKAQGPGPYFSVEPGALSFGPSAVVGQTFMVNVMVHNVTVGNVPNGLGGVEFQLTWDNTLIQPVNYTDMLGQTGGVLAAGTMLEGVQAGFYLSDGATRVTAPNSSAVMYRVAGSSLGGSWWGDGVAAQIAFQIVSQPSQLSSSTIGFSFADMIDRNMGQVTFTTENCSLTFVPQGGPCLMVDPQSLTLGPTNVVGQTFTINVELNNITQSNTPQGVQGLQFQLTWDPSLICPVSYTDKSGASGGVLIAPVLYGISAGFYTADGATRVPGPDYSSATNYQVAVVGISGAWWGSGVIASLTFRVISQPPALSPAASCPLQLLQTEVVDPSYSDINVNVINGLLTVLPVSPIQVEVDPQAVTLGPSGVVGQNFTVDVSVQNASVDNVVAGLGGVSLQLTWDPTLIMPLSYSDMLGLPGGVLNPSVLYAVPSGFYDSGGNPIIGGSYANATCYMVAAGSTGNGWWGSGMIVQVTFQVLRQPSTPQPSVSCSLNVNSSDLTDINGVEIPCLIQNGTVTILPATGDVAATNVSAVRTVLGLNYFVNASVLASNVGGIVETFNVSILFDTVELQRLPVTSLMSGSSAMVSFRFNVTGLAASNSAAKE